METKEKTREEVHRPQNPVKKRPAAASGASRTKSAAEEVHKEWSFNVMLRTEEALTQSEVGRFAGEELLVQGTVDCCFIEDGAWILLDYKTDRSGDLDALKKHYEKQLHVYALALERITGIPVRQKMLCLLASDVVVEI